MVSWKSMQLSLKLSKYSHTIFLRTLTTFHCEFWWFLFIHLLKLDQFPICFEHCLPSWKLYKLDEPDMQDTAGEARTSSSVMYSYGPPHMAGQKQDDQLEHTFSSYVRIRDVALKTCQKRWMIGRSGERGSGISMQAARHDDDDVFTVNIRAQETIRGHQL